jgi:hypothetical protein
VRDCPTCALSGGELENRARSSPRREPPRPEVRRHANHNKAAVEEDGVDRTAHEPRMNRPRRTKKKTLSLAERASAEQAPEARERSIGHEALLASEAAVDVLEGDLHQ